MPPNDKDAPKANRKYEVGTALDYHRQYLNPDKYSEIFELEDLPSVVDLRKMFHSDAQARQLFSAVKLPVRRATWDLLAGKGDKGEKDFVEWALHATARQGGMTTPMRTVIGQMANAIAFRYTAFEKVWRTVERGQYKGYHALHKLGYRPPATVNLRADDNGSFDGFTQEVVKGGKNKKVIFTPQRSVVYVHGFDESGLPGMTPFDTVYQNWRHKVKVSFFYFAFLENVAFPRTLVKVADDDPESLQHLLDKARKLASQGIIGLYEYEDIQSYESQRNTRDYQTAIEFLNWEMARAVFGQVLDLGTSGERGSYALSRDKMKFLLESLEVVLQDIAEVINNFIIADMVQYNFGRDAAYPRVRFKPLNDESAEAVLETYRNIVMANTPNVTPDFMLQLMKRVEEILDLEIDPMAEYDEMDYLQIVRTIPTAREHLLSKESRAGSGQNPITGLDRNENNLTPQQLEAARRAQRRSELSDELDIVSQMRSPSTRKRLGLRESDE